MPSPKHDHFKDFTKITNVDGVATTLLYANNDHLEDQIQLELNITYALPILTCFIQHLSVKNLQHLLNNSELKCHSYNDKYPFYEQDSEYRISHIELVQLPTSKYGAIF